MPVRERQEVQVLPRKAGLIAACVTSPTICAACAGGWARRTTYLDLEGAAKRLAELEAEVGRPDLWDDTESGQPHHPRVRAGQGRRRGDGRPWRPACPTPSPALRDGGGGGRRLRRRRAGDRGRRPERPTSTSSSCARLFTGRARRARRGLRDPRQGRRHRRPGLGRDDAAHVPALGGAAGLRHRDRRGQPRARRPGSSRPPSSSRAATPPGCWRPSAACTGWSASRRSTPRPAGRRASRR